MTSRPFSPYRLPLPEPDEDRWTVRRKLAVVQAVDAGEIDMVEACRRFHLSLDELEGWISRAHDHGMIGLSVRSLQTVGR